MEYPTPLLWWGEGGAHYLARAPRAPHPRLSTQTLPLSLLSHPFLVSQWVRCSRAVSQSLPAFLIHTAHGDLTFPPLLFLGSKSKCSFYFNILVPGQCPRELAAMRVQGKERSPLLRRAGQASKRAHAVCSLGGQWEALLGGQSGWAGPCSCPVAAVTDDL